jgi:hypothetical protein
VYSTCQFLGAFFGGTSGGLMLQNFGVSGTFWLCAGMAVAWLLLAIGMQGPQYLRSITLDVQESADRVDLALALQRLPGVRDVLIVDGESLAYMQVDTGFEDDHLQGLPVRLV